jgi:hypothetical protein
MHARNLIVVVTAGLIALTGGVGGSAFAAPIAGDQAWVEMAPGGGSVVRVVTGESTCPAVVVNGRRRAMAQRAAPGLLAPRPNKAMVVDGASFARLTCELPLARGVRRATLAGVALPVPRARINRIVLIGDTGCRLKLSDNAWQACNDPAQWPFAAIAAKAAATHPDLVLHVGDYQGTSKNEAFLMG